MLSSQKLNNFPRRMGFDVFYKVLELLQTGFMIYSGIFPAFSDCQWPSGTRRSTNITAKRLQTRIFEESDIIREGKYFVIVLPPALIGDFDVSLIFVDNESDLPGVFPISKIDILSLFRPILWPHYILFVCLIKNNLYMSRYNENRQYLILYFC